MTLLDEQFGVLTSEVDNMSAGKGIERDHLNSVVDMALGLYREAEKLSERVSADQKGDWKSAARSVQPDWVRWHEMAQRLLPLLRDARARGIKLNKLHDFLRACNAAKLYGPGLETHIAAAERIERGERGIPLERLKDELRRRAGG